MSTRIHLQQQVAPRSDVVMFNNRRWDKPDGDTHVRQLETEGGITDKIILVKSLGLLKLSTTHQRGRTCTNRDGSHRPTGQPHIELRQVNTYIKPIILVREDSTRDNPRPRQLNRH